MDKIQICINRFDIPSDITVIIKDYIWYENEIARLRKIKYIICLKINKAFCSSISTRILPYWYTISNKRRWLYRISNDISINCVFCYLCGNYMEDAKTNAKCECLY